MLTHSALYLRIAAISLLPILPWSLTTSVQAQSASKRESVEELPAPAPVTNPKARAQVQSSRADSDGTFSILDQEKASGAARPLRGEGQAANNIGDSTAHAGVEMQSKPDQSATAFPRIPTPEGYDILLQGPLHEAFGQFHDRSRQLQMMASYEPPPPLDEQKPSREPGGKNRRWLSGYWAWHDLLADFVWVSGMYREVPPGRKWQAGFWTEVDGNFIRIPGFWAQTGDSPSNYLPTPPASRESGPDRPAASEDSFWLPGHWAFDGGEYKWKKGFWTQRQSQWLWEPARYVWTPKGYLFVSGYWDYEPTIRGQLYAAIGVPASLLQRSSFRYQAVHQIQPAPNLLLHLFVQTADGSFHWGDSYGEAFRQTGLIPWFEVGSTDNPDTSWISYYSWKLNGAESPRGPNIRIADRLEQYHNRLLAMKEAFLAQGQGSGSNEARAAATSTSINRLPSSFEEFLRTAPSLDANVSQFPDLLASAVIPADVQRRTLPNNSSVRRASASVQQNQEASVRRADFNSSPSARAASRNGANPSQESQPPQQAAVAGQLGNTPTATGPFARWREAAQRARQSRYEAAAANAGNAANNPPAGFNPPYPMPGRFFNPLPGFQPPAGFRPPAFGPPGIGGMRPPIGGRRFGGRNR